MRKNFMVGLRAWAKRFEVLLGAGLLLGLPACLLIVGCRNTAPPQVASERPRSEDGAGAIRPKPGGEQTPRDGGDGSVRPGRRRSRRGAADRAAAPGSFDFYLLNLSWSPEFCATHGSSPECGKGLGFVVHGLWPQDVSGDYPEDCSDAAGPPDPAKYKDLIPTASLVEHEWKTHGTCSGLAPDAYFGQVRKAYQSLKIPSGIGANGDSMAPQELLRQFAAANPGYPAGSVALSCGNNYLTAVEVCLSKDLRPEACQGVRSCRAQVIRVTAR